MKNDSPLDYANVIRDKAIKMEKIDWQKCRWLQPESLKTLMEVDFKKLVKSFQENDSIDPLKVWQEKPGTIWILDGHHRHKVLEHCLQNEKKKPPRLMNAIFIDCKDKREAAKFCLLYATEYAKIEDQGLYEFLHIFDLQFDDIKMEIELPGIDLNSFQACYYSDLNPGAGGSDGGREGALADKFIVPPFSIFDTRQGYWQERKKMWNALINDHGESRKNLIGKAVAPYSHFSRFGEKNKDMAPHESILDPVLSEVICKWFCTENGKTFDPFAGDTIFGYVSSSSGHEFTGIELRKEQVELNQKRVNDANLKALYICDDGQNVGNHVPADSMDLLFSCPPYFDLEKYSNLPNDASNQKDYDSFLKILATAFQAAIKCLKNDRFAVVVVGDIRDKEGFYRGLIEDTKLIFKKNGMPLYNEIILIEQSGTAALRAGKMMKYRKVTKTHQNVLVFYKGDPKKIKENYPALDFSDLEDIGNEGQNMEL